MQYEIAIVAKAHSFFNLSANEYIKEKALFCFVSRLLGLLFSFFFVWWQAATLFIYYLSLSEHTYNIYIYNSSRTASCCLHSFRSVEGLLWGAEPRFELGPALQQADALLIVPRRTLIVPRRTLIVPRRTLFFYSQKLLNASDFYEKFR